LVPVANCRLRAFSATVFGLGLLRRCGRKFGRVSGDPSDFPSDSYRWVPSRKVCSLWTNNALLRWTIASGEHDILHMQVAPNKSAAVQRRSSLSVRFGHHWPGVPERGRRWYKPMHTYLQTSLSLVVCIGFTGCISGPSKDERSPEVRGRVVDAQSHQPIAGATIALEEHPSISALSDNSGAYRLRATHNVHLVTFLGICSSEFPAGKYYGDRLQVSHPLYQMQQIRGREYRDQSWTNSSVLVLKDISLLPVAK